MIALDSIELKGCNASRMEPSSAGAIGECTEHITLRRVRELTSVVNSSDRFWQALTRWDTAYACDGTTVRPSNVHIKRDGRPIFFEDQEYRARTKYFKNSLVTHQQHGKFLFDRFNCPYPKKSRK